jgi:hypothetical protein
MQIPEDTEVKTMSEKYQSLEEYVGKPLPMNIIALVECGKCHDRFPVFVLSEDAEKPSWMFQCFKCGIIVEVRNKRTWIEKIGTIFKGHIRKGIPRPDLEYINKYGHLQFDEYQKDAQRCQRETTRTRQQYPPQEWVRL